MQMLSVSNLLSGFLYLRAICRFLSFNISFVFEWAVRRDEFGECCSFAVHCLFLDVQGTQAKLAQGCDGGPSTSSTCRHPPYRERL